MKRMIRASVESAKWQEDVFDGERFYELTTEKGRGVVTSFDHDGDWGYDVRIDVKDVPSAGGIRNTFRGRDSKLKAMEYVENILCKTKVKAADDDYEEMI